MSSILLDTSTEPFSQEFNENDGLDIIGQEEILNQFFIAGDGDDSVIGSSQSDRIVTGKGNDTILGEDGDDIILGGKGNDLLNGGAGFDTMIGGKGNDIFEFLAEDLTPAEIDEVVDFNGNELEEKDLIRLQGIGSDASVEYDSGSGIISIDGVDYLKIASELDITIDNFDGDDTWELF